MVALLVVESDKGLQTVLAKALGENHRLNLCSNYREAVKTLEKESFDAAIVDLPAGPSGGQDLLASLQKTSPYMPIIVTSKTHGTEFVVSSRRPPSLRKPPVSSKPIRSPCNCATCRP